MKFYIFYTVDRLGIFRSELHWFLKQLLHIVQAGLRFAVRQYHIAYFLHWPKDEEGIKGKRKVLAGIDGAFENKEQQAHNNYLLQEVYKSTLYKRYRTDAPYLLQLQFQYFYGSRIKPAYLLARKPQAFYQLYIAQRFCRRSGKLIGFPDNIFLYGFYSFTERAREKT